MRVAMGFRTHSGWAALVAIGSSLEGPVVCDRRKVILADAEIRGSKQPYHEAEPMPLVKAKEYLRRCTDSTYKLAVASVMAALGELQQNGHEVVGCGMLTGSGRMPESVEGILASHAAIHTAEGELYRNAIAHACERCKLALTRVREKEAFEIAETALGLTRNQITDRISAMGRTVGPPWTQDQKLAAMAAWVAVSSATGVRRRKIAANQSLSL
jgi:hypothetical protein